MANDDGKGDKSNLLCVFVISEREVFSGGKDNVKETGE